MTLTQPDQQLESGSTLAMEEKKEEEEVEAPQEDSPDHGAHDEELGNKLDAELARTKSTVSIAESMSLPHEILFVALICLAQFMTQAGLGQMLSILHIVGAHYNITNPGQLSWLVAGYSLTVGTFILFSGRLGDVFGYKKMLVIGFGWFSLWSMVAGLAVYSNFVLFVFARTLQGIGPAIILPNGLAILGSSYQPGKRKDMVFALFGATAPGGSIVGGVFGGIFGSLAWWPWTFWSTSITLAAITLSAWLIVPDPPRKASDVNKSLKGKILDLDLPGAITGIVALILINFAWNQAPIVGWQEPYVYVTLILGFLIMPVFFYIELKVSKMPLIPFDALSGDVPWVLACISGGWACFGVWIYYLFQYLEVLRGLSPLLTMAWLSPLALSGAMASITTGFLLSKIRAAWVMVAALTCFLVGTILIATDPVDQIYWAQTFVCTIVIPWGMDMSFPAATVMLSNSVAKKHQGIAASLVTTVVNYSISLGLGFAGTVEVHVNNGGLTFEDTLKGYRGALYMGIGTAGLGLIVSVLYLVRGYWSDRKKPQTETSEAR